MMTHHPQKRNTLLTAGICIAGILIGTIAGFVGGSQPLLIMVAFTTVAILVGFLTNFETVILGLLIVRSSLDIFSAYQIPAALALGLDALAFLYIAIAILTRQPIKTDGFWWFFLAWVMFQGLWVILLPLNGLGMDPAILMAESIREWLRLFSMLMIYLLVMQLKDRIPPPRFVSLLMLSLIVPLTVALIQTVVPPSSLPPLLVFDGGSTFEAGSRINGTMGHPSTFATFVLLFLGVAYWKLMQSRQWLPWLALVGVLAFFLVSTKSLTGLSMLMAFTVVLIVPRLNAANLIGGILLVALVLLLFASSEFGRERFSSLTETPLMNPNIDWSRAVLMSWWDGNSFNWRIAQWTFLLKAWREAPIWGHGLGASSYLTVFNNYAHNDYIRALTEEGIVGLFVFLVFLGAQVVRLIQIMAIARPRGSQWNLCLILFAVLLSMFLGMATDNVWAHTTLFFYWWTLLAIAGWDWNEWPSVPVYEANRTSRDRRVSFTPDRN